MIKQVTEKQELEIGKVNADRRFEFMERRKTELLIIRRKQGLPLQAPPDEAQMISDEWGRFKNGY